MNKAPFSFETAFDTPHGRVFNAWWNYDTKNWSIHYVEGMNTYEFSSFMSNDDMLYGLYKGLIKEVGGVIVSTRK